MPGRVDDHVQMVNTVMENAEMVSKRQLKRADVAPTMDDMKSII